MNTKYSNSTVHNRRSIRLKGYDYRLPGAYFITLVSWQRECSFGEVVDGRIQLNSIGTIIQKEWRQLARHFPQIRLEAFVVMPNHVHGIIVIETVEADHPSIVRATRPSVDEIRETHDSPVDPMKDRLDGSPRQMVRATRLPVDEMRDTNDILVDQMKNNLDGSPRQEADETRGTNDSPVDPMEDNLDGSPRQEADEIRGTYDSPVDPMKDRSDGSPQQTKRPNGPQTNSLGAMIGQFKSRATKRIWALTEINRHPIWQRNYYEHIIRDDLEYRRIVQYIETNPLQWHDDQLHPIMQR